MRSVTPPRGAVAVNVEEVRSALLDLTIDSRTTCSRSDSTAAAQAARSTKKHQLQKRRLFAPRAAIVEFERGAGTRKLFAVLWQQIFLGWGCEVYSESCELSTPSSRFVFQCAFRMHVHVCIYL